MSYKDKSMKSLFQQKSHVSQCSFVVLYYTDIVMILFKFSFYSLIQIETFPIIFIFEFCKNSKINSEDKQIKRRSLQNFSHIFNCVSANLLKEQTPHNTGKFRNRERRR